MTEGEGAAGITLRCDTVKAYLIRDQKRACTFVCFFS